MDATMYLFLNRGAGMSTGKASAQIAHAAVEAYRDAKLPEIDNDTFKLRNAWLRAGHYKKLVMLAEDETHLLVIQRYLEDRGLRTYLIIDEGLTEIRAHTACALGVPVVDKDDPEIRDIFSTFKLYREEKPEIIMVDGPAPPEVLDLVREGRYDEAKELLRTAAEHEKARHGRLKRRSLLRRRK